MVVVSTARNPRLVAAISFQIENHSIVNVAYRAAAFAQGSIFRKRPEFKFNALCIRNAKRPGFLSVRIVVS